MNLMSDATSVNSVWDRRRWLTLGVIGIAQLMIVLDVTVMNIALPSAQHALHFTTVDRQWVVTAYTLTFGSLLLLGGRLADLLGRKTTFLAGLAGFAVVSAIGGASVSFAMLITARACQGAFAALLVPSALSLLTTTFTEPNDRAKAFGIYGAIAGAGGAIGLLLGGALTEYLSWRWTLYVNLIFAGVAFTGGALLLARQPSPGKPRLDIPGALLVSSAVFCLVYGFSNAAAHTWATPSTYGFLAAWPGAGRSVRGLAAPGGPPAAATPGGARPQPRRRLPVDIHRHGRAVRDLLVPDLLPAADAGLLAARDRRRLPADQRWPCSHGQPVHDRAHAQIRPQAAGRIGDASRIRRGGLAGAAGPAHRLCHGRARPAHPGRDRHGHGDRANDHTGTFGVAPQDAGEASATVTVGQMLGGSVGTALLNTIFAAAVTSYIAAHLAAARIIGRQTLAGLALAHRLRHRHSGRSPATLRQRRGHRGRPAPAAGRSGQKRTPSPASGAVTMTQSRSGQPTPGRR